MNFDELRKRNGSFVATAVNMADYRAWLQTCSCEDCGAKYADRPRDAQGHLTDVWVTETLCRECFKTRFTAGEALDLARLALGVGSGERDRYCL